MFLNILFVPARVAHFAFRSFLARKIITVRVNQAKVPRMIIITVRLYQFKVPRITIITVRVNQSKVPRIMIITVRVNQSHRDSIFIGLCNNLVCAMVPEIPGVALIAPPPLLLF